MDIKKEPLDVVDTDLQYESQWRKYKEEFLEDHIQMKSEENDPEDSFQSEDGSNYQRNAESTLVSSSAMTPNPAPHFEVHVNEVNIKREFGDGSGSLKANLQVACLRLKRVQFFRQNFVCDVCFHLSPTPSELKCHKDTHKQSFCRIVKRESVDRDETGGKPSAFLPTKDPAKSADDAHMSARLVANASMCKVCGRGFSCLSELNTHNLSHFKRKSSKCDKIVQSNKKPIKCDECDYSTTLSGNMKLHRLTHSGDKPFKCEQCDYSCITSSNLKRHNMRHSGEKPFKCDQCDYSCILSTNMKLHIMTHSAEKPFKCEQCDYSSITSSNMKRHKMRHTGVKPFGCDQCEFSCINSGDLKRHKMIHSGEKPFKCDECDYSCIRFELMRYHKRIHTRERPFKCNTCNFSCRLFSYMKKHSMIHSGEKPLKCDRCNYSCIYYSNMTRHKLIHK